MITNNPFVSIIIPCRNSSPTVKQCMDSLLLLDYKEYEIIMIDDGSIDDTKEIIQQYTFRDKRVTMLVSDSSGPSKARNMGILKSKGDYVAFTDADCIIDKNWLNELLKGFNDSKDTAAVGGVQLSPSDDTSFGKNVNTFLKVIGFVADYMKDKNGGISDTEHNPTCNVMYKKKAILDVSGFLEGLWPGEDVEMDYRIKKRGWLLKYNPKAVVYHYRPGNLKRFIKMMYNYGRAQGFLVKRYGPRRLIHFIPLVVGLGLISLFILKTAVSFKIAISGILFVFIFLLARSSKKSLSLLYFVLFIILMVSWNLGFIKELFIPGYKTA